MTFREKLSMEYPDRSGPIPGCEKGCPSDYGYAPNESRSHCQNMSCTDCWSREMSESKDGEPEKHDPVNHPSHYAAGGIECIDAIAAALTCQTDPVQAWLTGQVIKYLWRWPLKNGAEDLRKAQWYLNRLIESAEGAKK